MCIIVDNDRLGRFLSDPTDNDSTPIRTWLDRGRGLVVYATDGGFREEIARAAKSRLAEFVRAGRAIHIPVDRFADDERELRASDRLRSDDPHVLALARASGARLLYTGDVDRMADFKDKRLIDNPRGKVYTRAANRRLLTRSACQM